MLKSLHNKFTHRLVELLAEADEIEKAIQVRHGSIHYDEIEGTQRRSPDYEVIDGVRCIQWMTKCATLVAQIIPEGNPNRALTEKLSNSQAATPGGFRYLKACLNGIKDDFENGFLDDAWTMVRAEIASDYLGQASTLLNQGYHVPAAVLAGAVLEDALRKLCDRQGIPLDLPNGKHKTIDPLNTDLTKVNVYNSAKAHEIRGWASLRNEAAHGNGAGIDAKAVERMVEGVNAFVGDHLR